MQEAYLEGRRTARQRIQRVRGDRLKCTAFLCMWWDAQANPKMSEFAAGVVDEYTSHLMKFQQEWEWTP